jgi:hypothetical protein
MSEYPIAIRRNIWMRGLLMILLGIACHLAGTVLFFLALVQFVLALTGAVPNPRLTAFGRGLGRYLSQIAGFVSFATEEPPFPFSEWPSSD